MNSNEIINEVLKHFDKKIIDIGHADFHNPDIPDEMQVGELS